MATGAELVILSGSDDGDPTGHYPDDVYIGEAERSVQTVKAAPQLSLSPFSPVKGAVVWVKKNPVLAAGLVIAAVYLVMKIRKRSRR